MSKELSRLRGVRRAYKGRVTQDINKAERLMSAEDDESEELTASVPPEEKTKSQL